MTELIRAEALCVALVLAACSGDSPTIYEPPHEPCAAMECSEHGSCFVFNGTGVCVCDAPYVSTGRTCVDPDDPCSTVTCSGHGMCVAQGSTAQCQCDAGYVASGLECVLDHDGGLPGSDGGTGEVPSGCEGVACGGGGQCTVTADGPTCIWCPGGFVPHGATCLPADDPCSTQNCGPNASCEKQGGRRGIE